MKGGAMSPPTNAGSVLLELLEHADVATLSVLLAADNLLTLLRLDGWPDARIEHAFTAEGKRPGELLLGLLRGGRDARALLVSLGPTARGEAADEGAEAGLRSTPPPATARQTAEARWGMAPFVLAPRNQRP